MFYYDKELNSEVNERIIEATKDLQKIVNIGGELLVKLLKEEKSNN